MVMQYIKDLKEHINQEVELKGWVANKRSGKGIYFIVFRDGSGFCQCVVSEETVSEESFTNAGNINLESSIELKGKVVADDKQLGGIEVQVSELNILQIAEEYPIAKKEHGVDFLLDHRHLWLRSRKQWAIMRLRNHIIFSIHQFFQERGFHYAHTPLFTGSAAEGTTTLFETDYYGQPAYLAQTGQLYGEAMAMALGKIYTFGPTFRAEKSKTRRHLSEFWMIEPEMAFYDATMNMDLIEEFIKSIIGSVLENCQTELETLERDTSSLEKLVEKQFPRIQYTDAVAIIKGEKEVNGKNALRVLEENLATVKQQITEKEQEIEEREAKINSGNIKKGERNFNMNKVGMLRAEIKELQEKEVNIPQWLASAKSFEMGNDFGGSDETVLTQLFDTPVMVHDWPKKIKAFYMKESAHDKNYVQGVDVLAPEGIGEIVGGSVREENLEVLKDQIKQHNLPLEAFEWYLDLRKYGSVPHAGFGLGLERFVMWVTGVKHVRETIPFPRYYGRLFP